MAALAEAFVAVRADTSKVKGDVEKGVKGADVEGSAKRAGHRWGSVFSASLGAAAGAGLIKFGKDSVAAFKESEVAQTQLSNAFAKFPKLADVSKQSLQDLNSELAKKTKFDDDATASGQAVLAQFKLTGTQIAQLTPLLQDYAAKTGKSLPEAATVLGKAVGGNGKALKAIGLNLKDTGSATGNYTQLMKGLRTQVGGFAEQEGRTAAGRTEILKNQFGELQETVGSKLVPILQKAVTTGLKVVNWIQKNSDVMKPLLIGLSILIPTIYALNLALSLNPISLVVIGLAALAAALVVAYKRSETFRIIVTGAFTAFKTVAIPAIKFVVGTFLGMVDTILTGAAKAFGWVPKLGPKLQAAAKDFHKFRDDVNRSLDGIDDEAIKVALSYQRDQRAAIQQTKGGGGHATLAGGGGVFGPGTGTSDSIHALLSNGEHVLTAREVTGAGGHGAIEAMRAQWRRMATGGRVGLHVQTSIPGDQAIDAVSSSVARSAGRDIYLAQRALGINPGLAGVLDFVRSQLGKPYVWGGVGPGGYDCSGLVSAAINRAYGRNPYQRLGSTGSMPWGSFAPGPGAFMVGWFQGNPGHTAATVNGVNIESAGGVGVRMGARARGAYNALFTHRMHVRGFAGGGAVEGDPPYDLLRGRRGLLRALGITSFDRGGWLQPGWTLAHNGTGRPEPVGGAVSVSFTNCTFAGTSEAQFTDLVVKAVDRARSKRRI